MRALVGLVGLLVAVGVLVWVFSIYSIPVAKRGREAQTEVAGYGLQTVEGERYQDMVKLDEVTNRDGQTVELAVRSIKEGSEFQRKTGLKAGDVIVEVGNQGGLQRVRDFNDGEIARNTVIETPRGKWPLKVRRDGKEITLQGGTVMASASDQPTPAPTAATPTPSPAAPADTTAQTSTPAPAEQPAAAADQASQSADSTEQPKPSAQQQQRPAQRDPQKRSGIYGQVDDIREKLGNR